MVAEAILTLVVAFVEWFVNLVPDFGLDLGSMDLGSVWTQLGSAAAALNGWAPVVVAGGVAVSFLVVQVVMSVWGFIVWLYHQFWGSD